MEVFLLSKRIQKFSGMEDERIWAQWNHCFDRHLSCLEPVSCVFTLWVSSGLTVGSGCSLTAARCRYSFLPEFSPGLSSSRWRAAITDEGATSFVYWYVRKHTISHKPTNRLNALTLWYFSNFYEIQKEVNTEMYFHVWECSYILSVILRKFPTRIQWR